MRHLVLIPALLISVVTCGQAIYGAQFHRLNGIVKEVDTLNMYDDYTDELWWGPVVTTSYYDELGRLVKQVEVVHSTEYSSNDTTYFYYEDGEFHPSSKRIVEDGSVSSVQANSEKWSVHKASQVESNFRNLFVESYRVDVSYGVERCSYAHIYTYDHEGNLVGFTDSIYSIGGRDTCIIMAESYHYDSGGVLQGVGKSKFTVYNDELFDWTDSYNRLLQFSGDCPRLYWEQEDERRTLMSCGDSGFIDRVEIYYPPDPSYESPPAYSVITTSYYTE